MIIIRVNLYIGIQYVKILSKITKLWCWIIIHKASITHLGLIGN